jgi:putative transposase
MPQDYRHSNTSVSLINYQFVFIPRWRREILVGEVEKDLKSLIETKTSSLRVSIVAMEVMPDHVHLFINATPQFSPDQIMFHLKGFTSRMLRLKYRSLLRMPSLWTRYYFVSTAGNVSSEAVQNYIANQKSHGGAHSSRD